MKRSLWMIVAVHALATPLAASEAMAPEVVSSARDCMEYRPQVAYNLLHDEYLVVWYDADPTASTTYHIWARRLDRYGRPKGAAIVAAPFADGRDRVEPAVAYDRIDDRYLLVYVYDFTGIGSDWDILGRYLSWDLQSLGDELTIADAGDSEWTPQVAHSWASETFLVTWTRVPSSGLSSVRGALVSDSSVGANLPIGVHASQDRIQSDVAYQPVGDNFLVTYSDGADVYAKIVTANGTMGGEIGIAGWPDVEDAPAVATCEDDQYVVAWQSAVGGGDRGVFVRLLSGDGTIQSSPILIENGPGDEQYPDLSCAPGGAEYLVVWENVYANEQTGISARRLRASQELRPAFGLRPVYGGETGVAFRPKVAGGATGWLTVWEHVRQSNPILDIHDRVVWSLFADGFEWGSTNQWSSVVP